MGKQTKRKMAMVSFDQIHRNQSKNLCLLDMPGAHSLIGFYVPANGIELIVLPLHDGQT
jgi:hypothetical protein